MCQRPMSSSDPNRKMDVPIVQPFTRRLLFSFAILFGMSAVMIRVAWYIVPWIVMNVMAPNTIQIAHANYGGSCGARDVTAIVSKRCEGRSSCNIVLDPSELGDATKTCAGGFAASWTCSGITRDVKIENAGPKSIASITCPADAREGR